MQTNDILVLAEYAKKGLKEQLAGTSDIKIGFYIYLYVFLIHISI